MKVKHILVATQNFLRVTAFIAVLNLLCFVLFLPRDAMRKRGLCCGPVSVRPSRWCIVSTWLKISSNFFLDPVAPLF